MRNWIDVVHFHPGRVRVKIKGLRNNHYLARSLERTLGLSPYVIDVKASSITGRALIIFDPYLASEKELLLDLSNILNQIIDKVMPYKRIKHSNDINQMKVYEPEDLPLKTQILQVVVTGVILMLLVFKRLFWGKSVRAGSSAINGIAAITTIVTGYPILRSGVDHLLFEKKLNNDFLISAATIVSLLMKESITGLVVVWLVNLSTLFQTMTLDRSRKAIRDMLQGKEQMAWLEVDGTLVSVPIESLKVGDIVACHVGEKIPIDGKVVKGEAAVSQAVITGESVPLHKVEGDKVFAGSIVEQGNIKIEAEKVGQDTSVARIIHLVEQSSQVRAPIENIADRYSEKIVPLSFGLAALVYLLTGDFKRSMTMLIVACPCAAGLSTPTAVSAALGNAARKGILIKGGSYLERIGSTDVVLFDKTGTLTEGKPSVRTIVILDESYTKEALLQVAASMEAHTNHPLASAVVRYAENLGVKNVELSDKEVIIGHGIRGIIEGQTFLIGSEQLLSRHGINLSRGKLKAQKLKFSGQTVLYIGQEGELIALIGISDKLREQSPRAIDRLRREAGIQHIGLITGDCSEIGQLVGEELGLDKVWTQVLPEDKVGIVREFQDDGQVVTMVGEGVNDSPALAKADIGIAMGTGGTDIAIESADVVLAGDDPEKVASLIKLSNHTMEVIRQNFIFAVGINALGIVLGAGKWISPLTAAILHNLSTFGVVINSSKLLTYEDYSGGRRKNGYKRLGRKDEVNAK